MQRINESLENRLRRVKQDRKRRSLGLRMKANAWKTSIAKEILDNENILITYVTDKHGFRKGVVLATGAGQLGWSLVSPEDYEYKQVGIEQIPKLASFIQNPHKDDFIDRDPEVGDVIDEYFINAEDALQALIKDPVFKSWIADGGYLNVPRFERALGITIAMDRARLYASIKPEAGLSFADVPIPNDPDLRDALAYMNIRSHRYFQDGSHAMERDPRAGLPTRAEGRRDN